VVVAIVNEQHNRMWGDSQPHTPAPNCLICASTAPLSLPHGSESAQIHGITNRPSIRAGSIINAHTTTRRADTVENPAMIDLKSVCGMERTRRRQQS
jgi:hypothetical protein